MHTHLVNIHWSGHPVRLVPRQAERDLFRRLVQLTMARGSRAYIGQTAAHLSGANPLAPPGPTLVDITFLYGEIRAIDPYTNPVSSRSSSQNRSSSRIDSRRNGTTVSSSRPTSHRGRSATPLPADARPAHESLLARFRRRFNRGSRS